MLEDLGALVQPESGDLVPVLGIQPGHQESLPVGIKAMPWPTCPIAPKAKARQDPHARKAEKTSAQGRREGGFGG